MTYNTFDDASSDSNIYFTILMIPVFSALVIGLAAACGKFARAKFDDLAESNCDLDYKDREARITAGVLGFIMHTLHTKQEPHTEIAEPGQIVVVLDHNTVIDSFLVGDLFRFKTHENDTKARAPWWYATDIFGQKDFLEKMQCIPVKANAKRGPNGERANQAAIDEGNRHIRNGDDLFIYPTGNWADVDENAERFMIRDGAAEHAIDNNKPLWVLRLSGLTSLTHSFFSESTRNAKWYRALATAILPNDAKVHVLSKIEVHLKEENQHLGREALIRLINAELDCARLTPPGKFTDANIQGINRDIAAGKHLDIYDNRAMRDKISRNIKNLTKELEALREEGKQLESTTDKEAMLTITAASM